MGNKSISNTILNVNVSIYGGTDVVCKVSDPDTRHNARPTSKRGVIRELSKASRRRMKLILGAVRQGAGLCEMTLTYPGEFPWDGRRVKRDLKVFLEWTKRAGITIAFWTMEYQERGAPHYHLVAYIPDLSRGIKEQVSLRWYEIVGSGDERHLRAGTRISPIVSRSHLLGYLGSYYGKEHQKTVPQGFESPGRFWGYSKACLDIVSTAIRLSRKEYGRKTRLIRRWYRAKIREWYGVKSKLRGSGFTVFGGVPFISPLIQPP